MNAHVESKGGYEVADFGSDTYFDAAGKVGEVVGKDETAIGVLVCGTGMGVGMVANKYSGVRAATVENLTATRYARAVNDANVICLGQLVTKEEDAKQMIDAFLDQDFNSQPTMGDGNPAPWWSNDVENFLSTSKEGISRVEKDALAKSNSDP